MESVFQIETHHGSRPEELTKKNTDQDRIEHALINITSKLTSKILLSDALSDAYETLRPIIPFDRLGIALLDSARENLVLKWVRSQKPFNLVTVGYSAPIEGSSLKKILETGTPRIINDLNLYLRTSPQSHPTQRLVAEGIQSSLTFPLVHEQQCIGVIFFSSTKKNAYDTQHIRIFKPVATQLSLIVVLCELFSMSKDTAGSEQTFRTTLHDLRAPLAILKGFVSLLADDMTANIEESHEILNMMKKNCSSMEQLLNDLVEVNSMGHTLSLKKEPVRLESFLQEIKVIAQQIANKKEVQVNLEIPSQIPSFLQFDREKIKRVFENLVTNAVKYSKRGTSIIIGLKNLVSTIEFFVRDEGVGIKSEELNKLFKEFGKTSSRPTESESSTGLGLFIVKKIVELHGGSARAESIVGKGSTLYFTIPLLGSDSTTSMDCNYAF